MTGLTKQSLRIAVLDDHQRAALASADWSPLGSCEIVCFDRSISGDAAAALADFDVLSLMRERTWIDSAFLDRLPRLQLIVVTGDRFHNVDRAAAAGRGGGPHRQPRPPLLRHGRTGGGAAPGRRTADSGRGPGDARGPEADRRRPLAGRADAGTAGAGPVRYRDGGAEAGLGNAADRLEPEPDRREGGGRRVSREDLFRQADALSLHLVLSETTHHIVGATELALMKPDAILVNTSRASLIDEAALVGALRNGRPGMAALDVFEQGKLPRDHPLRSLANTVLAPHMGFVTTQACQHCYSDIVGARRSLEAGDLQVRQPGTRRARLPRRLLLDRLSDKSSGRRQEWNL